MKIRVYYEDTDLGGIVYHTNYIKYCERARSELFFSKGFSPLDAEQRGFIVRNIKADFLATSTLGDILEVKSTILRVKKSSMVLLQEVFKEDIKVFSMEILLVYVDNGKPIRIPEDFKTIFDALD